VGGAYGTLTDFTALGDSVNIAAHLASQAGADEIVISEAAYAAVGLDPWPPESRQLELKGKSERTRVRVLRVAG
jgi:class 3 adenylate cyclase